LDKESRNRSSGVKLKEEGGEEKGALDNFKLKRITN
jgi:hypothetical protein